MLLEGETAEALSRLRELVHAEITFKELARQTGLGEKTLHRMLNRGGNPRPATWDSLCAASPKTWAVNPACKWPQAIKSKFGR